MTKVMVEISEEDHIKLLELQLERKKDKSTNKPTAVNKIASELLAEKIKELGLK